MTSSLRLAVYDDDTATAPEPPGATHDLNELRQAWAEHLTGRGRATKYIQHVGMAIDRLLVQTRWRTLAEVEPAGLDAYLTAGRAGGWTSTTHDNHLAAMRAWGSWMVKTRRWRDNLFAGVEPIGNSTGERGEGSRSPTTDELRRLIQVAKVAEDFYAAPLKHRRHRVYMLAALTGLRHGELRQLARSECVLDVEHPFVSLDPRKCKNRKRARIPLCPEAAQIIRDESAEFPAVGGRVFATVPCREVFLADMRRAGIPVVDGRGRRLTFHGLRKYTATALIESGTDLGVVQRLMRHSCIALTMRCYNDVPDSRLGEAVDHLPAIAPGTKAASALGEDDVTRSPPQPTQTPRRRALCILGS